MELFTIYLSIACYICILAAAVYFAVYAIRKGKMEPEKEIELIKAKRVKNAHNRTD